MYVLLSLTFHAIVGVQANKKHGSYWSKDRSMFFKNGKLDFPTIMVVGIRATLSWTSFIVIGFLGKTSLKANISPAVSMSLICINPFLTAVLFTVVYKEKLMRKHYIGMVFLLFCVLSISFSKALSFHV
jgi:drug/metabolite transporter (DMT)-like permease